jgi:hypothetical protein
MDIIRIKKKGRKTKKTTQGLHVHIGIGLWGTL